MGCGMGGRGKVIFSIIIILSVIAGGCERKEVFEAANSDGALQQTTPPISETRLMLDTLCKITIYDSQDQAVLDEALDLCEEYESLLSISLESSDVWRINHAGGAPVIVAPQTADIIRAGLKYGELSEGMFDITIGRLSTLWDFTGQSGVPAQADIALARETVDYRQVTIDGNSVQLADPETWIDLGGIAKGYIADSAAGFLKEKGITSAVIDLGGNIVVLGRKPDGEQWRVGVTRPFNDRNDLIGVVETYEASVVSSGIYERQFEENGVLYHHILDPNTGLPAVSDVVNATVLSESSMDGDALSTMLVLLGSEKVESMFADIPELIGAVLLLKDGELLSFGVIDFQEIMN